MPRPAINSVRPLYADERRLAGIRQDDVCFSTPLGRRILRKTMHWCDQKHRNSDQNGRSKRMLRRRQKFKYK